MLSASLKQRFKASDLKSLRLRFPALNPQRFENAVICDCEFASLRSDTKAARSGKALLPKQVEKCVIRTGLFCTSTALAELFYLIKILNLPLALLISTGNTKLITAAKLPPLLVAKKPSRIRF